MEAKEMFKALGYEQEYHFSYIKYYKKIKQNCCDDIDELEIWFYQIDESFEKVEGLITMEELKAINQQCKELGWLDKE